MEYISKFVTLIESPEPPEPPIPEFDGTLIRVRATAASPTFGIATAALASGHAAGTVAWGDGITTSFDAIRGLTHTYAEPGLYDVIISDDIKSLGCSSNEEGMEVFNDTYAPMIQKVVSRTTTLAELAAYAFQNAVNLTEVDLTPCPFYEINTCSFRSCSSLRSARFIPTLERLRLAPFAYCTALEKVEFPGVRFFVIKGETSCPFYECTALREIHFSAANEQAIKSGSAFTNYPDLGAPSATISFDL